MPRYYIPKKEFKIVSYEEIKPYVDLAQDDEMKFCIAVVWLTGARIQEIINLNLEDVRIDEEKQDIIFYIKALKFGKIGYPTFGFNVPFIKDLVIPYVRRLLTNKFLSRGKRRYQQFMKELNEKIHGDNKKKWITFHYLRHSRLAFLGRVLRAFPEEFKSWTGHRSSAFEDYFAPRRVERFKDKIE